MRAQLRSFLTWAALALPLPIFAQTAPTPPTIIACEGPNMPAACPTTDVVPRSLAAQRSDLARREVLNTLQAQQMMVQRQALLRGSAPPAVRAPPLPGYQPYQPNPYLAPLAPPDFKAAAQIMGNVINGGPHN